MHLEIEYLEWKLIPLETARREQPWEVFWTLSHLYELGYLEEGFAAR